MQKPNNRDQTRVLKDYWILLKESPMQRNADKNHTSPNPVAKSY